LESVNDATLVVKIEKALDCPHPSLLSSWILYKSYIFFFFFFFFFFFEKFFFFFFFFFYIYILETFFFLYFNLFPVCTALNFPSRAKAWKYRGSHNASVCFRVLYWQIMSLPDCPTECSALALWQAFLLLIIF